MHRAARASSRMPRPRGSSRALTVVSVQCTMYNACIENPQGAMPKWKVESSTLCAQQGKLCERYMVENKSWCDMASVQCPVSKVLSPESTRMCLHMYTLVYSHTCMHTHRHVYTYAHVNACVQTDMCTHARTHIQACALTHTNTHAHAQASINAWQQAFPEATVAHSCTGGGAAMLVGGST